MKDGKVSIYDKATGKESRVFPVDAREACEKIGSHTREKPVDQATAPVAPSQQSAPNAADTQGAPLEPAFVIDGIDLTTLTKRQLQDLGKERFGIDLTGNKDEMVGELNRLESEKIEAAQAADAGAQA